jgi:CubicO group peptidase (beta-lactamase class C family)
MLHSTSNLHLLPAVLTRASGRSTPALAEIWLGEPLDRHGGPAMRFPGHLFRRQDMLLSPRALLRLAEMQWLGSVLNGRLALPEAQVRACWTPRTTSAFTGTP